MAEKHSAGQTALENSPLTIETASPSSTEVDTNIQAPNCRYFKQNLNLTDFFFFFLMGGRFGGGFCFFFFLFSWLFLLVLYLLVGWFG